MRLLHLKNRSNRRKTIVKSRILDLITKEKMNNVNICSNLPYIRTYRHLESSQLVHVFPLIKLLHCIIYSPEDV